MSDSYVKLSQLITTGTRSEKVIANLFLSDYPFSALGSLTEVSNKTNISIPTIQRMVIKLGFKGYPEFRKSVLEELAHEKGA
jgi:Transcriptional regulators